MLFLLLPLSVLLTALFFIQRGLGARQSILAAILTTGSWAVITSEVLGLFHALTMVWVAIAWIGYCVGVSILLKKSLSMIQLPSHFSITEKLMFLFLGCIGALTLFTVFLSGPNTWDAMSYHLPRVIHWAQNHTLEYYPTGILRQLVIGPGYSYLLVQVFLLFGSMDISGIVQWLAMIVSIVAASLIAKELGANRQVQLLTGVLVASIPMGVLQAVSVQGHYVATMWLSIFVYWWFLHVRQPKISNVLMASVGCVLSGLTKESSYIFIAPFLIWGMFEILRKNREWFLRTIGVLIIIFMVLNAGHLGRIFIYAREWDPVASVINGQFNFGILLANILRNTALNFDIPFIANGATQGINAISGFLGINLNDPQGSFSSEAFGLYVLSFDEDYMGSFGHVLLGVLALFGLIKTTTLLKRKTTIYGLLVVSAFILFCAIVRFQPWHMRFELSLWLLMCPVLAVGLSGLNGKFVSFIVGGVCCFALMTALYNRQHPWLGGQNIFKIPPKMHTYYKKGPQFFIADHLISEAVRESGCKDVGYIAGENSWQYPIWQQLRTTAGQLRFEHVDVKNASKDIAYPLGEFLPCLIISENAHTDGVTINNRMYMPVWRTPEDPYREILVPR